MADWGFTNRPDLLPGIFGHHLLTQWNIGQSEMLQSMQLSGVINLRDFNFNGAPLSGTISAALEAGSSLHLSNHPDLRPFLQQYVLAPIEAAWEERVDQLNDLGASNAEAMKQADAEFSTIAYRSKLASALTSSSLQLLDLLLPAA